MLPRLPVLDVETVLLLHAAGLRDPALQTLYVCWDGRVYGRRHGMSLRMTSDLEAADAQLSAEYCHSCSTQMQTAQKDTSF